MCEYSGNEEPEEARKVLGRALEELYENGFTEDYVLDTPVLDMVSRRVEKKYGSAVVAICFVDHIIEVV